jgi:PBP1b-binding outer membrane lipoprotein LpoB
MLRIMAFITLAILIGAGCSDDKNPVREYGTTLTGAVKKAEKTKVLADMATIRSEIMRYKAENSVFPPSLNDLNMKDIDTDLYTYNPETGQVALAQ